MLIELNTKKSFEKIKVGDYFLYDNEVYIKTNINSSTIGINIKTGESQISSTSLYVTPLTQKKLFTFDFERVKTKRNLLKAGDCILLNNGNDGIVTNVKSPCYEYVFFAVDLFTGNFYALGDTEYEVSPNATITIG